MTRVLPETPILGDDPAQILTDFFEKLMLDVHTTLPGRILKYEGHESRKAEVEVSVNIPTNTGEFITVKPIANVPVVFPSVGSSSMLFPIKKGDGVLLLFSETGIGNFLNGTETTNADNYSKFKMTDCIAIPGLFSDPQVPKLEVEVDETSLFVVNNKNVIKMGDDGIFIKREDDSIEITKDSTKIVNNDGVFEVTSGGKFKVQGTAEELVSLLSEFIQTLSSATVITGIGPQPFTPVSVTNFNALKTRLDTLKA